MRCWIEVSKGRLAANFASVSRVVGPDVEVCPVVKADAYGHGAVEVSRVLTAAGARTFTAAYAGDTNFGASNDTETHQVNVAATTTTITTTRKASRINPSGASTRATSNDT